MTALADCAREEEDAPHTCYTEDFLPGCQAFNFSEHKAKCESLVPAACAADRVIKRSVEPVRERLVRLKFHTGALRTSADCSHELAKLSENHFATLFSLEKLKSGI